MSLATHARNVLIAAAIAGVLGSASLAKAAPEDAAPPETKQQRDQRMAWWREARFGMFIHWGLYAVPAGTWNGKQIGGIGEWIMHNARIPVKDYEKLTAQFNPVKFDADQWVSIAKNAGMKYIVITSKHHDGFAMFHSQASPYNIHDATPFKRDPLKELAEACRKQGIKLGFYYSQCQDWHHPGGEAIGGHWDKAQNGDFDAYLQEVAVPQVKEILTNYPISVLWWDTPTGAMTKERAAQLAALLKLRPGIIHNNRLGGGFAGDSETPEQFIPPTGFPGRDWETCMTLNDTWGYKSYDNNWKPAEALIRNLIDIASKGGNYLLNVGPTAEGLIPAASVERLAEVGKWMKVNGEAIYGTSASPFKKLPWGRCTQQTGKLYLHVFDWPKGDLLVPGLKNRVTKAYLLADASRAALPVAATESGVSVKLPADAPDKIASVVVLEIEGQPELAAYALAQAADGSIALSAGDAALHGALQLESGHGKDNIGFWTNQNDWVSWDVTVKKPGKFDVELVYACENAAAGSEFTIAAGEEKLAGKVEGTGGWGNFVTRKLGAITLSQAGRSTISVKATAMPHGAVMNLHAIALKPVAQ
jgi:alpha-L-fucosidase